MKTGLAGLILFLFSAYNFAKPVQPSTKNVVAAKFREAINTNNLELMLKLVQLPLGVDQQEWATLNKGYGFTLKERKITRLKDLKALKKFMKTFLPSIRIKGKKSTLVSQKDKENLKIELAGMKKGWRSLLVYLFLRGEGDVEHIVLLGIDPLSRKIRAIYVN